MSADLCYLRTRAALTPDESDSLDEGYLQLSAAHKLSDQRLFEAFNRRVLHLLDTHVKSTLPFLEFDLPTMTRPNILHFITVHIEWFDPKRPPRPALSCEVALAMSETELRAEYFNRIKQASNRFPDAAAFRQSMRMMVDKRDILRVVAAHPTWFAIGAAE